MCHKYKTDDPQLVMDPKTAGGRAKGWPHRVLVEAGQLGDNSTDGYGYLPGASGEEAACVPGSGWMEW